MQPLRLISLVTLLLPLVTLAESSAVDSLLDEYRAQGAPTFSAAEGAALWRRSFTGVDGESRTCESCHSQDPEQPGRHVTTGKEIAPIAPSRSPERLTDTRSIEKWLTRNCKWTLGRECTVQERGDLLSYLRAL